MTGTQKQQPTQQQILEAVELEIRQQLDDQKIYFYAESLKQPWSAIYAGKNPSPSYEEIIAEPGEWIKTPVPGLFKPFAHKYQRQMTYPFDDPMALARLIGTIFYCYFGGNQSGKSVYGTAWVNMECLGIHPLQQMTFQNIHDLIENTEPGFFKKYPELDFPVSNKPVRPKPPVHWWVVCPDLPAEAKIDSGEDIPSVKTFMEWCPKKDWKLYRKDKIATIKDSTLNWKSHDQAKKKLAGERLDGILWDEEPPRGFWEEGKQRILKKHGIFLLGMTSDWGSWTWELEKEKDNSKYVFCNMDAMDNPFVDKEMRRRIYSTMNEDEIMMRRFGKHIQMKGKVFPFDRNTHIGSPFEVTNDNANFIITDWHPVKPIITTFLSINPQNIWYIWTEKITMEHIVDTVAQDIWQTINLKIHNLRIRKWIIDPIAKVQQMQQQGAKPVDIITMFRQVGIRYIPGNPVFDAGHTFLCQKMNLREFYVDPKCQLHIDQFDTWGAKRYQRGNLQGNIRDLLEVEGNDCCINAIYAYNAKAAFSVYLEEDQIPPDTFHRPKAVARIYGGARV